MIIAAVTTVLADLGLGLAGAGRLTFPDQATRHRGITTPVIMPGRYLSLVPNHPLTMGGSLASANATVINIRRQMVAAWSFRLRCPSCSTGWED